MKAFAATARILMVSVLMVLAGSAAAQQAYPNKLIRIIVPTVAGGSTSAIARLVAQHFTASWGQQVIVENRAGGNTIVGTEWVAKSAPDGYTLLVPSITHVLLPLLTTTPYDPIKDFAPISGLATQMYVMLLHPSVPANNLREFIALTKARPGQVDYSISGAASGGRMAAELFSMMAGVKMQLIPYKGGAQALTDLVGGQVQLSFQAPITVIHHLKSGRLRAIGVTSETRSPALPEVPTMAEAGLPGVEVSPWQGILAPAGTPREVVDKLSAEIARHLAMPDIVAKLAGQGVTPFASTPDQFAALLKADMAKYAKVIKVANIKLEN